MPIRFRCYFCRQRLTISRRKMGTVIQCPRCQGQVWVPDPDNPDPEQPAAGEGGDIILIPLPEQEPPYGAILLSPQQIRLLLVVLVIMLTVLFVVGVWVGRSFRAP
jgi:hypothetical protein